MRIFHYTAFSGGYVNSWQYDHIVDELSRAGHDVRFYNAIAELGCEGSAAEYSERLLDALKKDHETRGIDLFFAVAQDALITPEAVGEIRAMGIPTLHLSCDDLSHPFRIRKIAPAFDVNWSTVRESRARLESYGATVRVLPWGTNPHFFRPETVDEERVICFMGTPYGARGRHVANLAQAGVPVRVYGSSSDEMYGRIARVNHPMFRAVKYAGENWQRITRGMAFPEGRKIIGAVLWRSVDEMLRTPPEKALRPGDVDYRPSVPFTEMGRAYSRAGLSLGSIELASTYVLPHPLLFIRLREFEVPMCGGVHLVNRFPEMLEYFEEDREMLYYSSTEELIDKARFWLDRARDGARSEIRVAARRRAEGEHTWLHRFRALGPDLGLKF